MITRRHVGNDEITNITKQKYYNLQRAVCFSFDLEGLVVTCLVVGWVVTVGWVVISC